MALDINRVKYNDSWPLVRLKEACNRISDGTHFTPEYVKEGTPFISVKDIYDNKVHFGKCKYITPEAHKELTKRCHPEKDDILITKSGTIGRMALVPEKPEFSLFVSVALIKNKREILDSKFLKFCLENFINSIDIAQDIKGGLLKNFHLEDIRETLVPIVPLPVQHAIVTKIEEIFSELDHGVAQLKTARQQLKVYRQAVLKWAFEGRLTYAGVKDGKLPEGWKWVKTGEVINTINNGYTPTKEFLSEGSGEIPFIKVYNLNFDGTLNFKKNPTYIPAAVHQKDLKRSICYPGDVLINIVGPPLGKISVVTDQFPEWNINQAIVLFRPNEKVTSKFIAYFMQNSVTINWLENTSKATAGQWNVKVSTCREIPMPLVPLPEQHRIVSEIERRLSVCDKLEETIEGSLKAAEVLRAGVLKRAFEGKLV